MQPNTSHSQEKSTAISRKSCPYQTTNSHAPYSRISTPYNYDYVYDDISHKDPSGFQKIKEIWSTSDDGAAANEVDKSDNVNN
jgi:hypothetical protein